MSHRRRRSASVAALLAAVGALLLPGPAGAGGTLPTMTVHLSGAHGVTVSGAMPSGAVNIVSTFSGHVPSGPNSGPAFGIIRLDPGVSITQAAGAVFAHHQDINALTPYGTLLVSQGAPSVVQTVLTPGNYVALNISGGGKPGFAPFTVTQSSSPAALPAASATETAIEFGFRGPTVLHDGKMVRAVNGGWLVHMIALFSVPNRTVGHRFMTLLRAGHDTAAQRLLGRHAVFGSLMGPASPGAMQQEMLNTKPGLYVEACFMNTLDGREHTQLGMERMIRVVK